MMIILVIMRERKRRSVRLPAHGTPLVGNSHPLSGQLLRIHFVARLRSSVYTHVFNNSSFFSGWPLNGQPLSTKIVPREGSLIDKILPKTFVLRPM